MSYILLNRTKDISGNKYGDLVVIDFAGYVNYIKVWIGGKLFLLIQIKHGFIE